MTDERTPSYMLEQCQELGLQIVRELTRAIEGIDNVYSMKHLLAALAKARRIRDIHEEEGK